MERRPSRTATVWLPDFAVTAVGADLDAPVAVVTGERARRTVAACSPAARELGVRRGQRLRDAQRLCPQLEVHSRDLDREARAFEPVLAAAETVAAAVEVVRPGLIVLEANGPARYHGGEAPLAWLLRDAVAQLATATGSALGAGVAVADGIFAASLAARHPGDEPLIVEPGGSPAFLAHYPLAVLDRPALADTLGRLGVHTLGALAQLPAAQVANRFGADGLLAHRLASGLDPRPPAPNRPSEDLAVLHEFDPPAESDEPVLFAGKALADRLHALLATHGVTCMRLEIELTTEGGRTCVRRWRHADISGGALTSLAVAQRLRWTLDAWKLRDPHPDRDPVVLLRLVPDQLVVDRGSQQALWGREQIPDRVERAAERVQALLGHEGVLRPYLTGGRDPLTRIGAVSFGDLPVEVAAGDGAPWPGVIPSPAPPLVPPQPYPATLVDAAGIPVGVTGRARLTGEPARLTALGSSWRVTGWAGPWPYSERAWSPAGARRRARLQCATEDGRAWLLSVEGGAWQVEGVYQ